MSSVKLPAALLVVAASLAWIPASHAGTSFSFSIHGGSHHGHGYNGKHFSHYHGHRGHYYLHPRYRGYHRSYGHRPYRHRTYSYLRRYPPPGPPCIYRYGYRYCR